MRHVTDAEISLLVSGRLEKKERQRILRHVLTRCPLCSPKLAHYAPVLDDAEPEPPLPSPDEAAYDAALDRAFSTALRRASIQEEDNAWRERLLAEVAGKDLSIENLGAAIPDETPGRPRIEVLIALSFEARYRDPAKMLYLALAAQAAASNLEKDPEHRERYTPAEIADLQARAWCEVANAYRVREDAAFAERALANADLFQEAGSGDTLLLARLLDVRASLRTDQRQLAEAAELLDCVYELYLEAGETHLAGRALVSKAIGLDYDDRPREAVDLLRQGLSLLDPARDPKLVASSQMSLLDALEHCGECQKASRLLLESGLRQAFAAEPLVLLKLRWVEGKIFAGLGKLKRAEKALKEVEDGFFAVGLHYEAALASLERAGVLLQMGRAAEVEALAQEALETFEDLEVGREAVRAVRCLREACRQKAATTSLVKKVVGFLQRFQDRPSLRFEPA